MDDYFDLRTDAIINQDRMDTKKERDAATKKSKKPLIEKRRRARINDCLQQLKEIIVQERQIDKTRGSRLEKADILEMTVDYIRRFSQEASSPSFLQTAYELGVERCVHEMLQFMTSQQDMADVGVMQNLANHCRKMIRNQTTTQDFIKRNDESTRTIKSKQESIVDSSVSHKKFKFDQENELSLSIKEDNIAESATLEREDQPQIEAVSSTESTWSSSIEPDRNEISLNLTTCYRTSPDACDSSRTFNGHKHDDHDNELCRNETTSTALYPTATDSSEGLQVTNHLSPSDNSLPLQDSPPDHVAGTTQPNTSTNHAGKSLIVTCPESIFILVDQTLTQNIVPYPIFSATQNTLTVIPAPVVLKPSNIPVALLVNNELLKTINSLPCASSLPWQPNNSQQQTASNTPTAASSSSISLFQSQVVKQLPVEEDAEGRSSLLPSHVQTGRDVPIQTLSNVQGIHYKTLLNVSDIRPQSSSNVQGIQYQTLSNVPNIHPQSSSNIQDIHPQLSSNIQDIHPQLSSNVPDIHSQSSSNVPDIHHHSLLNATDVRGNLSSIVPDSHHKSSLDSQDFHRQILSNIQDINVHKFSRNPDITGQSSAVIDNELPPNYSVFRSHVFPNVPDIFEHSSANDLDVPRHPSPNVLDGPNHYSTNNQNTNDHVVQDISYRCTGRQFDDRQIRHVHCPTKHLRGLLVPNDQVSDVCSNHTCHLMSSDHPSSIDNHDIGNRSRGFNFSFQPSKEEIQSDSLLDEVHKQIEISSTNSLASQSKLEKSQRMSNLMESFTSSNEYVFDCLQNYGQLLDLSGRDFPASSNCQATDIKVDDNNNSFITSRKRSRENEREEQHKSRYRGYNVVSDLNAEVITSNDQPIERLNFNHVHALSSNTVTGAAYPGVWRPWRDNI